MEHQGIKIEFIGQIELFYDRGNHHEFKCLAKALARPGDLIQYSSYPFEFPNVEKQFEIYNGSNVRLRYFLRVTIVRRISDITKEVDIAVHTLCSYPDVNNPIKMEVGIEDCLHIEFEYNKSKYHLKDTIIGKIYFLLVRIKIKHMEIAIIKRECTGSGSNVFQENETIAKFEIMDGAPVKGESIPIRVFLAGYNLTPTMRDINKKFSVKYFLNLVLMDTEDRRYFKQQEITLWRKADIQRYHGHNQPQQNAVAGHNTHPQHAPPHLVSGPPAPIAAPHLTNSNPNVNVNDMGVAAPAITSGSVTSEGKMGLFTRESPNQEFSQQSQDSLPTSPITPTAIPIERGMGDGAAAISTSPVMLSSTPPPLPSTAANAAANEHKEEAPGDFIEPTTEVSLNAKVDDGENDNDDKPQVVPVASSDFLDSDDAVTSGA